MARLSPEQRAELVQQLADDDAAADDFEVEIWNDDGRGARLPYSKGKAWLSEHFGIDLPALKPAGEGEGDPKPKGDEGKGQVRAFNPATRQRRSG